jgi:alpha-tubulin suppressor-like RCC1 family protein
MAQTIAGRKLEAEIEATLSPAKRKEFERAQKRIERKKLEAYVNKKRERVEEFYYGQHYKELHEKWFNPKINFPDIHGSPQQMEKKGWLRTLQQRHQPTNDATQLQYHITAYRFRQRDSSGNGEATGQNLKDGTMLAEASAHITLSRATIIGPLRRYHVVNISAGTHHLLCVTSQGKVLSMGEGRAGQLGLGNVEHTTKPQIIKGELRNRFVVQCAAGASHSLVRTKTEFGMHESSNCCMDAKGNTLTKNYVYAWGDNSRQQLGLGDSYKGKLFINKPSLVCHGIGNPTNIRQFEPNRVSCLHLSAGAHHSVALSQCGNMFTWGSNQYGQIGDGGSAKSHCAEPKMVVSLRKQWIVDCTAGDMHTVAVTESGDLWSWGRGSEGQLGHGCLEHVILPKLIHSSGDIYEHVTAGRFHTLCRLNNGTVRSFGKDTAGMLGTNGLLPIQDPGGMEPFGPLHCKIRYGSPKTNNVNANKGEQLHHPSLADNKSNSKIQGVLLNYNENLESETNVKRVLLPSTSLEEKVANNLKQGSNTTESKTTSRVSPKRSPPPSLPTVKNSPSRMLSYRKSPIRSPPRSKPPPMNSPKRSSKKKMGNHSKIVSSLSPVYKLGPSITTGRHAETRAILHRAHTDGIGRKFKEEDDFIVQLSAGVQHSIALTKRGLAYSFGFAGGNGRLGHGDYIDQHIPKYITVLKDDVFDADEWAKRALLDRLVDVEKHTNPKVKADSTDPKDVDYARPHNRVSEELIKRVNEEYEQQSAGNFAFESMRAFRSVDKGGEGEVDWSKIRPALTTMRIPLRSLFNPFSVCRFSVDELCETVDEEETGFVDETGFIEFLVKKHINRKNGIPRKKYSAIYRAYKNCRGQAKDLRPNPDGRSTFINALEDNFIDQSLELGELVSREQCQKMFEYELELEFNEDGSKVRKQEKARNKIPEGLNFESKTERKLSKKEKKKAIEKKNRGKKNIKKLKYVIRANNTFSNLGRKNDNVRDISSGTNSFDDLNEKEEHIEKVENSPESNERQKLLQKQNKKTHPGKLSKKDLRKLEALISQPELLYGCLDLRGLGLTDKHVIALANALRSVPAVSEIDLRLNYVSDLGVEALLETMKFHNELTKYDSSETVCGKCGLILGFAQPVRQAAVCLDCGNSQWRPAYLLTRILVKEDEEHVTPSRTFKWFEVDYDKEACQVLANRLNERRHISLTRHEYAELHEEILQKHVGIFVREATAMIERLVPYKKAMKKTVFGKPTKFKAERDRLMHELDHLENIFKLYGKRMFEGKHVPRYGLVAVTQILKESADIRKEFVESVFLFFHERVPLENGRLLEGIQAAHDAACRRVDLIKWDCREMKIRVLEILYALARELYEHYLLLNAGATVCEVTSGHNCSYLLTREGTVVSMGSTNNVVDSFKEQIVTRLPDNFRANIEKGRAEKRVAAAASSSGGGGGDNNRRAGKSPLMLPSKSWSAFDEEGMSRRFAPPLRPGDKSYVDEDKIEVEGWKDKRYHNGIHHKDSGGNVVEDHDEGVNDSELAFSDRENGRSKLLEQKKEIVVEENLSWRGLPIIQGTASSLTLDGNDEEVCSHSATKKIELANTKAEIEEEFVENAYVGDHFYQGERRPTSALQLTIEMRERANVLVAEQQRIIEASLGQDKVKEYKRIASEMQSKKELAEQEKAVKMKEIMWNLEDILRKDAAKRQEIRELKMLRNMSESERRNKRLVQSKTGGYDAHSLEDLFHLFPGANKRFVQAMFEANGERDGMNKTLEILVGLQKEGVFDKDWDPDEDEDVIAARKETGLYSVGNFDV